jgi:hypothetical protein
MPVFDILGDGSLRRREAKPAVEDLQHEIAEMRLALCMAHAGAGAYLDDGEMQDNTKHPMIDWKRDTWETIKAKLMERGRAALGTALQLEPEQFQAFALRTGPGAYVEPTGGVGAYVEASGGCAAYVGPPIPFVCPKCGTELVP